jgi:Ni/Co efflux regulator RcnB
MKTLTRLFALVFAATLFAAPLPAPAQQKQDTMDKKESKKSSAKKKPTKKKSAAKTGDDAKNAPAPGPK